MQYASGLHLVYSQNFYTRRGAAARSRPPEPPLIAGGKGPLDGEGARWSGR